jgi:carbamoyltransferase
MKYTLGISAFYHDSAATLLRDDEIILAVQEERFTRIKHDKSFPINAIKFILKKEKIDLNMIDAIVFYEKPLLKLGRIFSSFLKYVPFNFLIFEKFFSKIIKNGLFQKLFIIRHLKKIQKNFKKNNNIFFSEHHLSHAASAFFPSPFEKALILTIDGVGEWSTTSIYIGNKNNIEFVKDIKFPDSIGMLYSAFTYYLGFKVNSGEYKVMGLAPYGKPIYREKILNKLVQCFEDGSYKLNMDYFEFEKGKKIYTPLFEKIFEIPKRTPETELNENHFNIASSIQSVVEYLVEQIVRNIKKDYKIDNICLAGGVALNCVSNGKILKKNFFKNIWIQPASGDAGGSLGAALVYRFMHLNKIRVITENKMKGSYLGPSFEEGDIKIQLDKLNAKIYDLKNNSLTDYVSSEISKGKIIGWFQGSMEFGPRALGARSILADPRSEDMQKNLNLKIKFRESFRPFAASIMEEHLSDWFDIEHPSPYMLIVAEVKNKHWILKKEDMEKSNGFDKLSHKKTTIPAVTHVDFSTRLQTVNKKTNKKFYELIEKFYEKTNCPILINTSFNIRGEPIVCSIEDAYKCFMITDMDLLIIEDFVLRKKDQGKSNYKIDRTLLALD